MERGRVRWGGVTKERKAGGPFQKSQLQWCESELEGFIDPKII